jgi:hypothetical protein
MCIYFRFSNFLILMKTHRIQYDKRLLYIMLFTYVDLSLSIESYALNRKLTF